MGFYGNITNAARTQFQFDRIYPNRKAMEAVQTIDGVYIGRYVLIEYGTDVHSDYYKRVWKINNKFYFSYDAQEQSELTTLNTTSGQIVRVEPDNYPDNDAGTTIFILLNILMEYVFLLKYKVVTLIIAQTII